MEFYVNIDDIAKLKDVPSKIVHAHIKATIKTLNREGTRLKTFLFKNVREEYMVKTGDLKKSSKETKAKLDGNWMNPRKSDSYHYELGITSKRLPLSYFGAREKWVKDNRGKKRKGVSVKVLRKGKRKVVKSAFLYNGHIFKRESKERYPLDYLTSLSIPQMFKDNIVEEGYKLVEEKFPKTYKDSFDFYASKIK